MWRDVRGRGCINGCERGVTRGEPPVPRADRSGRGRPGGRGRRGGDADRAVRRRQIHRPACDGRHGPARRGARRDRRHPAGAPRPGPSPAAYRLRLPALPPAARADRAGQRARPRPAAQGELRPPCARHGVARSRRPGPAGRRPALAVVGRPAATRRRRTRVDQPAGTAPGRRAHGQPGQRHRAGDHRPADVAARALRDDDADRDPRRRSRRQRRPGGAATGRQDHLGPAGHTVRRRAGPAGGLRP